MQLKLGKPLMYLRLREGKSAKTLELIPGVLFADFSTDGRLLGVEFIPGQDVDLLVTEYIGESLEQIGRRRSHAKDD